MNDTMAGFQETVLLKAQRILHIGYVNKCKINKWYKCDVTKITYFIFFPVIDLLALSYTLSVLESFVGLEISHQSHDFLVVPRISQPSIQSLAAFHLIKMQSY